MSWINDYKMMKKHKKESLDNILLLGCGASSLLAHRKEQTSSRCYYFFLHAFFFFFWKCFFAWHKCVITRDKKAILLSFSHWVANHLVESNFLNLFCLMLSTGFAPFVDELFFVQTYSPIIHAPLHSWYGRTRWGGMCEVRACVFPVNATSLLL